MVVKKAAKKIIKHARTKKVVPRWPENYENISINEYHKIFRDVLEYYRLVALKEHYKPLVVEWIESSSLDNIKKQQYKKIPASEITSTMAGISRLLLTGMPRVHEEFNYGKDTAEWLINKLDKLYVGYTNKPKQKSETTVLVKEKNIKETLEREICEMLSDLDAEIDKFISNPAKFDPKNLNVYSYFLNKKCNAAHAKAIRATYQEAYDEIRQVVNRKPVSASYDDNSEPMSNEDADLFEAYSYLSMPQKRKLLQFYENIFKALKAAYHQRRASPRDKKALKTLMTTKEQAVEHLVHKKVDDTLGIVSISPTAIVGARELYIFDCSRRRLGKFIAKDDNGLTVNKRRIANFDPTQTYQKLLRNHTENLEVFNKTPKAQLSSYLNKITSATQKLSGLLNEQTLLLKVVHSK